MTSFRKACGRRIVGFAGALAAWALLAAPPLGAIGIAPCNALAPLHFSPAHPGPQDTIAFSSNLGVVFGTQHIDGVPVVRTTLPTPATIAIDLVFTLRDPASYVGYRVANAAYGSTTPVDWFGPLPPGHYDYVVHLFLEDPHGTAVDTCGGPVLSGALDVGAATAPIAIATVVEYYNAAFDDYVLIQDPAEIAVLDRGERGGWTRTGVSFAAYVPNASDGRGYPICRRYGAPLGGPDAHLMTALAVECEPPFGPPDLLGWFVESYDEFELPTPNAVTGECLGGRAPVYRLWRANAHRYTPDRATVDHMIADGWVAEGFGPHAVAWCLLS